MKPVVFLPEAEQEMLEAAIYYHSKASGLAVDYLSEVERARSSYYRVSEYMARY